MRPKNVDDENNNVNINTKTNRDDDDDEQQQQQQYVVRRLGRAYIFYFLEKRLRRRRRRQRVRGTREEVYASEKTFSGEFKGEEFRTREWVHPEEFRRERDGVRDESVRRRRDDGRRGNGATRVEVVRAVRRRYGRESETGFDVVVDEKRKR